MLNGALVIEMVNNWLFGTAKERQSCQYLDQISGRREFGLNLLQKRSIGTNFC